jgi:ribonuclease BN (tRNA processing enzyme)
MQAFILGCGEAFDERLPNTSVLVRTGEASTLFDCGYNVPPRVWSAVRDASELDVIYISHAHADHYFGVPALLARMWEDGRTKPLTILSHQPVLDQIRALMELAYRTMAARFQFEIDYRPVEPGVPIEHLGCTFDFAETQHAVTNLAARLRHNRKTFCYSGDGMFKKESSELYARADLVVHEAYRFEPSPVHGDIPGLLDMAAQQNIRRLALVHVQRGLRRDPARILEAIACAKAPAILPEPGATFEL